MSNPLSKIAVLKLSPSKLSRFASESPSSHSEDKKIDRIKADTSSTPQPNGSENSTPVPVVEEPPRRRGIPGPKPGSKRGAPTDSDGTPKPKGKPGPKKRKPDGETGLITPIPAAAQKLGPKANTGAINAHLRALDRTGKPSRKWKKNAIALKTFTGVAWDLPYWQSAKSKLTLLEGEAQSESNGSSDAKEPASSRLGSDADKDTGNMSTNGLADVAASSPVSQQGVDVATPL